MQSLLIKNLNLLFVVKINIVVFDENSYIGSRVVTREQTWGRKYGPFETDP